jgi:hypothetical protein
MAHLREQGIDFAVFGADSQCRTAPGRERLLADLTCRARAEGLRIQKSALAYRRGTRMEFFGTPDLVRFLAGLGGFIQWTHTLDVN